MSAIYLSLILDVQFRPRVRMSCAVIPRRMRDGGTGTGPEAFISVPPSFASLDWTELELFSSASPALCHPPSPAPAFLCSSSDQHQHLLRSEYLAWIESKLLPVASFCFLFALLVCRKNAVCLPDVLMLSTEFAPPPPRCHSHSSGLASPTSSTRTPSGCSSPRSTRATSRRSSRTGSRSSS